MTKITFDLTEAVSRVTKHAENEILSGVEGAGKGIVRALLNDGRYKAYGPEGLAHEIIRKKIEDYVLSDAFSQKLDGKIEAIMDEEAEKAIRTLMNSKARKALFKPTSPVESERGDKWIIVMDGVPEKTAWNMESGWVPMSDASEYDVFSDEDKNTFKLPMGGMWMRTNA